MNVCGTRELMMAPAEPQAGAARAQRLTPREKAAVAGCALLALACFGYLFVIALGRRAGLPLHGDDRRFGGTSLGRPARCGPLRSTAGAGGRQQPGHPAVQHRHDGCGAHAAGTYGSGSSHPLAKAMAYRLRGIQLLSVGILGEYVAKIHLETKSRPRYFIEKSL